MAGGAVADADDTCVPKTQREAGFTVVAFHQWDLGDDDPLCVTTAEHVSSSHIEKKLLVTDYLYVLRSGSMRLSHLLRAEDRILP